MDMSNEITRPRSHGEVVIPAAIRRRLRDRLARAYSWFERTGRDLVEELHESRRLARRHEQDGRRP